jgi:hypothetical protein
MRLARGEHGVLRDVHIGGREILPPATHLALHDVTDRQPFGGSVARVGHADLSAHAGTRRHRRLASRGDDAVVEPLDGEWREARLRDRRLRYHVLVHDRDELLLERPVVLGALLVEAGGGLRRDESGARAALPIAVPRIAREVGGEIGPGGRVGTGGEQPQPGGECGAMDDSAHGCGSFVSGDFPVGSRVAPCRARGNHADGPGAGTKLGASSHTARGIAWICVSRP